MRKKYLPPTEREKEFNKKYAGKYIMRSYYTGKTIVIEGKEVPCMCVEIVRADKE